MANNDLSWFSEAHISKLFTQFPFPLVVLDESGATQLINQHFTDLFDASVLKMDSLREVINNPDKAGDFLRLHRRDGKSIEVLARAVSVEKSLVLILEVTEDTGHEAELAELHQRLEDLEKLSSTDRLTGAWNRLHFDKTVAAELSRSVRYKQPVSLIFLDIDHFKRVNDIHGHALGDEALRQLVKVVQKNIRNSDMLFRWGGEEFVVLAPSTSFRSATGVAESLRAKVESHPVDKVGHITISLGVAEHVSGEGSDAWFQRADAALYHAKNTGRNRVVVDPQGSSTLWEAEKGASFLRLTWHDSYNCGEPTIDEEHQTLFVLANALIDTSFTLKEQPEPFNAALEKLLAHVVKHFADEETILAAHQYEGLDVQKHAHMRLVEKALQLHAAVKTGGLSIGELVEFLANEVVARHMLQTDREFYPLFAKEAANSAAV